MFKGVLVSVRSRTCKLGKIKVDYNNSGTCSSNNDLFFVITMWCSVCFTFKSTVSLFGTDIFNAIKTDPERIPLASFL